MKYLLILVLLAAGAWAAMNLHNDQPLFSNPFAEKSMTQKIVDATKEKLGDTGKFIQEKGKALVDEGMDKGKALANKAVKKGKDLADSAVKEGRQAAADAKKAAIEKYHQTVDQQPADSKQ